jgi:hypothetical protein
LFRWHRAELVHLEGLAPASDAVLAKQHRPGGVELDQDRGREQQRGENDQAGHGQREVERPLQSS